MFVVRRRTRQRPRRAERERAPDGQLTAVRGGKPDRHETRHLERRDARQNRAAQDQRQNAGARGQEERRDFDIGDHRGSGAGHRPPQQEQRRRRQQRERDQLVGEVGQCERAPRAAQVPEGVADDGPRGFPHGRPARIRACETNSIDAPRLSSVPGARFRGASRASRRSVDSLGPGD